MIKQWELEGIPLFYQQLFLFVASYLFMLFASSSKQPVIVAVNKKLGMTATGKSCLWILFWVKFFDFYGIWAHARNPRNMVSFCHWVV